jgi:hypothetical protein
MILKIPRRFLLVLLVLAFVSLACNLGAPRTPAPPPPVSTEAVESLEKTLENAADAMQQSGEINLEIDEAQLTSLVAFQLEEHGDESIQDPQVYLRDGQIQLFGTVERQGISGTARVIMTAAVDAEGRPDLNIESASIGPLPIPEQIVSELESQLDQAFGEQIEALAPNTWIESIVIADGKMTITGHAR